MRSLTLTELPAISVAGINLHLVRQPIGLTAFGANAYSADAGGQLIEEHSETSGRGAAGHEELYVVMKGRATFTIEGEDVDAPAGTAILVQPDEMRTAVATEDGTLALVLGGDPGAGGPIAPWEHYFSAAGEKDPAKAYEVAARGLADWPEHKSLHRNLARFAEKAGMEDKAREHREKSEQ